MAESGSLRRAAGVAAALAAAAAGRARARGGCAPALRARGARVYYRVADPNSWDAVKAVLRGKFIALSAYIRKEESLKICDISSHLRKQEKEKQFKTKASRKNKTKF